MSHFKSTPGAACSKDRERLSRPLFARGAADIIAH